MEYRYILFFRCLYFAVDANGPAQGEMLTIADAFIGEAQLRFASYKEGMDIGYVITVENAISNAYFALQPI